ncbi:MAG: 1-acyl-sn-glycerol-3-phosphate acyltransferase, partial [Deltaproteobacteria bacterium]|nr:1-acyl-sn-glycerol-3-phosphate acyltransferase [Deltaproteobacteria bacterium]
MNKLINNDNFPYFFDYKPGLFLWWFFYRLVGRVKLDENFKEPLRVLQKEGTIVYAIKHKGLLDFLLYHFTLKMRNLPYPRIAFGMDLSLILPALTLIKVTLSRISAFLRTGRDQNPFDSHFYENALRRKTPSLVSLLDPAGFLKSFIYSETDNLYFLIEQQKKSATPIFIVPQLILFKRSPETEGFRLKDIFFGFKDNPSTIRKMILFFRHPKSTFIDFAEPVNLKIYLENQPEGISTDQIALELKDELIRRIDNQKRIILGPIMKSRQQLKEVVLKDKEITALIDKISGNDRKKIRAKRKMAGKYFDEIAADYNSSYVRLFRMILKWLWKKIFNGIDTVPSELAVIREWARKGPLIYVPSHKSHVDYLVLNDVLYDFNMHIPRIAAGQNLSFWPMGHIFRKCGAFFIRRSFQGAKLYSEVFSRYVKALLQDGHPIQFYIEGGRSRNGKLVQPKTGFLSILMEAYEQGYCNDLIFVPTSVLYDRVVEEGSYLKELDGAQKESENFRQVIKARRFLKSSYGRIYIRFDKPFSIKEWMQQQPSGESHRDLLAAGIAHSINSVTLITPLAIVSTAILTSHRKGFYMPELRKTIELFIYLAKRVNGPLFEGLADIDNSINEAIALLTEREVIEQVNDPLGAENPFYFIKDDKKLDLEYYKNTIIHFFIDYSLVAISLLSQSDEDTNPGVALSVFNFLSDTFSNEFLFDSALKPAERFNSVTASYIEKGFITDIPETCRFRVTRAGFDRLPSIAALAKTFIESYWIAANVIMKEKDAKISGENLLKEIISTGKKYYNSGVIDHIGSI